MRGKSYVKVPLSHYLEGGIRNGSSPVESRAWTGTQMLGLGCLTPEGFQPRQLKNAPVGISARHPAMLADGDLLISRANTRDLVGLVGIYRDVGTPCIYPDLMMRLRLSGDSAPEFLELVLRSTHVRRRIKAMAQGTSESMVKLSVDMVRSLPVPLVPLAEQRRIVQTLDAFVAVERSFEESITKVNEVRRGLLLASMVSVSRVKPSVGWVRVALKEIVPSTDYGISEALISEPAGTPVLRMNNIRDGRMEVDDLRYCPVTVPARLELRRGDVLFNRTNSIDHVGKAAMWRDELSQATFASYLVRLNLDLQRIIPEYLVEWLQHPLIRQRVKAISTVAVQQVNVNPTKLRELEIDLPVALEEQRRIVASLAACDDRIRQDEEELAKLRQMKLGLAGDLLAGASTQPQLR